MKSVDGGTDSTSGELIRRYGFVTATAIVVANMIGSGIFTTSGTMAAQLPGPGWVLACWLLGGLIALSGALSYAELATRMPVGGAEYVYLKRLYHPAFGFLTGWTSFVVGFSAPIGLSALGLVEYMSAGFSLTQSGSESPHLELYKKLAAIAVIATFTLLHYIGGRVGPRVQNTLTVMKILIITCLATVGTILGYHHAAPSEVASSQPFSVLSFGTAMMMVMFSYSGWNAAAYIAGEVKTPRKTLPRALIVGTLIVIVLYLAVNGFIFLSAPYAELKGTITVMEVASVRAFGPWIANVLSVLIGFGLLSSLGAFIMIGPRVYQAMAEDRLFFAAAARVHPRFGVPSTAILVQGLMAALLVVLGTFEQLLIYVGFALGIFPWLAVAGLFLARRARVGGASAALVPGFPFIPLFYLVSSLGLMIVAYINRPMESSAAVLTVLLGLPCYYLWIRGRPEPSPPDSPSPPST